MNCDSLIRKALDAGVVLQFVDGELKATGRRSAVTAWAPRLREHKVALIAALRHEEPYPDPSAWKELSAAYHRHHFSCPVCVAGSQGRGLRCGTGTVLWAAYQSNF